jgi:hypothetical protein
VLSHRLWEASSSQARIEQVSAHLCAHCSGGFGFIRQSLALFLDGEQIAHCRDVAGELNL